MKKLHLKIYGKVQGVFFRDSTEKQAKSLGLTGWVKNMPDSTVELVAEGREEDLKKMLKWCTNGPEYAQVERVEEEWKEITEKEFERFEVVF